jgi:hypothetical protein
MSDETIEKDFETEIRELITYVSLDEFLNRNRAFKMLSCLKNLRKNFDVSSCIVDYLLILT